MNPTSQTPITPDNVYGGQAAIDTANKIMGNGVSSVPNASLQQSTPITVPPTPTIDPNLAAMTSANLDLLNAQNGANTQNSQRSSDYSSYQNLSNQLLGKTADQLAAEQAQGIPDSNNQLIELQKTAAQQKAEYDLTPYTSVATGGVVTKRILTGMEASKQAQLAVQNIQTNANIAAMQGHIAYAQILADKAVAAKYDPIEQQLQTRKDLIAAHYQDLTSAQKKLADAKTAQLDLQKTQLAEKKAQETAINNIVLEAAKNGADGILLNNIRKATTTGEAITIAGEKLHGVTTDVVKLDNGNTVVIDKATGKVIRNLGGGGASGSNKLLSVSEAQALGVPYGTTQAQAIAKGQQKNVDANNITDPNLPAEQKNTTAIEALASNPKISSTMRTQLKYALGVITSAQDLASANQGGSFTGVSPFNTVLNAQIPFTDVGIVPFRKTLQSAGGIKNEQVLNGIKLAVGYWASGATLTAQQLKLVDGMTPTMTDTDKNVRTKLNALTNFMLGQTKSALQSEGIHFQPVEVNLFETKDMIDKLSPAQKTELDKQGLLPTWAK